MACPVKNNTVHPAVELLAEEGMEGLVEAITVMVNEAMRIERAHHLKAGLYERTEARQGYANGYKPKQLKTRLGPLDLSVPQVRDSDFYPRLLEKGLRSERALKLAIAEMYVQGVATRKVKAVLEELCGLEVSSSDVSRASALLDGELQQWRERPLGAFTYLFFDARYEKIRTGGCVVSSAVLIAYGIEPQGQKRILGVSCALSEQEVHWRSFMEDLVSRGLHGVQLITSDAHTGLKAALQAVFPSVPWQRCQFHLQQNAQAYVPKQSMKSAVAYDIRSIFNAPTREEALRLLALMVTKYQDAAPALATWMEQSLPEGLTVFQYPEPHRRRLRTSNLAERVNKEVKRRTRVAGLFPNVASCVRLVSAILVEIDDEWQQSKTYLDMDA